MLNTMYTRIAGLAIAAAVLTGAVTESFAEGEGTLSVEQGKAITATDLAKWIDQAIPADTKRLLVMTQCFGGDTAKAFAGKANTCVVSATSEGEKAIYEKYDDDAAKALEPGAGRTAKDVHDAGSADAGATPSTNGGIAPADFPLDDTSNTGDIQSRHVLVYAGQPDGTGKRDNWQRDEIKGNFAGKTNTSVRSVGGDGTGGWDKPGSAKGLKEALKEIGREIRDSPDPSKEQFIMFVTDHGDLHKLQGTPGQTAGCCGGTFELPLEGFSHDDLDPQGLFESPDNVPGFSVFVPFDDGVLWDPQFEPWFFGPRQFMLDVNGVPLVDYVEEPYEFDNGLVGDQQGEGVNLFFPVDEPLFVDQFFDVDYHIVFVNFTPEDVPVGMVSADSGYIAKGDAGCGPDLNGDGQVNSQDFVLFLNLFTAGDMAADYNGDGLVNSQDFVSFLNDFVAGC
jgi:hypothetical protein